MLNYYKNLKAMIIVPHEDDELNIAGGLLASNYFSPENTYIVYTTNGDYSCNHAVRIKESKKIANTLKIPFNNFIFLGYPDQAAKEENHIYNIHEPDVFVSKHKRTETFCIPTKKEFHLQEYQKHAKFNHESLLNDYLCLLNKYKPDVIFCVDFDSHPDHRCTSLMFEKTMGIILKSNKEYKPLIYKGFAYPTAYKGENDLNSLNFKCSNFKTEPNSLTKLQNPYYEWDERIRFPVKFTQKLFNNKLYKLLKIYRSQMIINMTTQIINSDIIFWQRRADNLCLNAQIKSSSGNHQYLNDFMLFDIDKITNGDIEIPKIKNNCWIPSKSDKKKEINIKLDKEYNIEKIVFYQTFIENSLIKKINIELSDGTKCDYILNNTKSKIKINTKSKIKWIKIKIIESLGNFAGFSEIEILPKNENLFEYLDVDVLNTFGQKKIYTNITSSKDIKFYYYNGYEAKYLNSKEILLNNQEYNINNVNYDLNKFTLKSNQIINKEIKFIRQNKLIKFKFKIAVLSNKFILKTDIFLTKIINKLEKIFKKIYSFNQLNNLFLFNKQKNDKEI